MKFIHREVKFNLFNQNRIIFFLKKMILKKWSLKTWREFHVSRGSSGEKKMELETRIILEGHQGTKGAKKSTRTAL